MYNKAGHLALFLRNSRTTYNGMPALTERNIQRGSFILKNLFMDRHYLLLYTTGRVIQWPGKQ